MRTPKSHLNTFTDSGLFYPSIDLVVFIKAVTKGSVLCSTGVFATHRKTTLRELESDKELGVLSEDESSHVKGWEPTERRVPSWVLCRGAHARS